MQSLWRPPNLPHHPTSPCPSTPPKSNAAAHTHKATVAFNPSSPKGTRFSNGRGELLLGFSPGISKGSVGRRSKPGGGRWRVLGCYSAPGEVGCVGEEVRGEYLVKNSGWGVRRLVEELDEMRMVASIQTEAFHVPLGFFDDLFYDFFKAEVLAALLYNIRNLSRDRYACLVAEPADVSNREMPSGIVGVVDITVQRDADILSYVDKEEYIYVSGIAVVKKCRRMKVGSSLLEACEAMSRLWGLRHLVLRAYEDDMAALQLYKKQGYEIVARDPKWMTTWIGRRRRILMIKSTSECRSSAH